MIGHVRVSAAVYTAPGVDDVDGVEVLDNEAMSVNGKITASINIKTTDWPLNNSAVVMANKAEW